MKNFILFHIALISSFLIPLEATESDDTHEFAGHHLVASLLDCNHEALTNVIELEKALENAANASGATILNTSKYVFPGNAFTMVILLSESHASIHTYPEYNACFVDLFTCGHTCSAKKFEEILENYLKPREVNKRMLLRNTNTFDEIVP